MKTISLLSIKGGCGKSTLTCLLALYWAEKEGKRVAINDRDRKQNSADFIRTVKHPNVHAYKPNQAYDYLLIDTPGGVRAKDVEQIIKASDLTLIPVMLSRNDILDTRSTAALVDSALRGGVRLVFNRVDTRRAAFKQRHDFVQSIPIKPLESYLANRAGYTYAISEGWQELNRIAINELAQLAKEVG